MNALADLEVVFCNWRDLDHPDAGGAELYCLSVAERFAHAGARVTLLTARSPGQSRRAERGGVRIVRGGGRFGVYPRALLWLLRHRRQVDLVIDCQNGIPFFSPLVLRRRTPIACLLFHVHQKQFALYFSKPVAFVGRTLENHVSRIVYGRRPFIVISPSTRAEARRVLGLRGPLHIVASGMDSPEHIGGARSSQPTIAAVGRLVPHKRFELLLAALGDVRREFPALHVHLMGDGPQRPRLEELARALGVDDIVTFHGRVDDAERDRRLASAWLTVNPSLGEGWGLSVIEANAHGLPAIAFRVPGLRDAVRDGETGWLVDEGAPLAPPIAAALRLLGDDLEFARWRARARRWARGFSWDVTAARIAAVLLSERDRLQRRSERGIRHERRRGSDLATRVRVETSAALRGAVTGRRTDVVRQEDGSLDMLLFGADEQDALGVLERHGVYQRLRANVARQTDLLSTHFDSDADPTESTDEPRDR